MPKRNDTRIKAVEPEIITLCESGKKQTRNRKSSPLVMQREKNVAATMLGQKISS